MKALDGLLFDGVAQQVFLLARAVVFYQGQRVYDGGNASEDTLFDLASLTKVMSTTALTLRLNEQKKLSLTDRVSDFFPNARLDTDATVEDLLYHRSGYPPFLCYFEQTMKEHPELFDLDCLVNRRELARSEVMARALETPPSYPRGTQAVYSDIGFMVLGEMCAQAGGQRLDALFESEVVRPLGLSAGYRRLSVPQSGTRPIAPTGFTRPREHAPGQETLWNLPKRPARDGEVDDDNAWCMDGVSGHAGLFSTATDVARFGQAVLDGFLKVPYPWRKDRATPASTRALGFDTPSAEGASCGQFIGNRPPGAIGHLGFTGTSLWVDLARKLVVVLLTNRTALGRANLRIREFRSRFHDAVVTALNA
ncbi:MAG: beta-lactamase family protein [Myxococcaceae bacterium]|nr:beta-lactamase family protein [Myxococcaceae bacterium]